MKARPFEATFASGVATAGIAALALFVTSESKAIGMWMILAAGVGLGWAWREATAKDRGEAEDQVYKMRRGA